MRAGFLSLTITDTLGWIILCYEGLPWGKNTRVGNLSLLQQIFLTQELNQVSCIAGGFFTS